MADITLYDYWRSSASYRVRIALNLKGLEYERVVVNLLEGEHRGAEHRLRSPIGYVPALSIDGQMMTQSLAIIEYLESRFPDPALLPEDPAEAARLRAIAHAVAMDIHPIANLNVTTHHAAAFDGDAAAKDAWMVHFMARGLAAVEIMAGHPQIGPYLHGSARVLRIAFWPRSYTTRGGATWISPTCRALPPSRRPALPIPPSPRQRPNPSDPSHRSRAGAAGRAIDSHRMVRHNRSHLTSRRRTP